MPPKPAVIHAHQCGLTRDDDTRFYGVYRFMPEKGCGRIWFHTAPKHHRDNTKAHTCTCGKMNFTRLHLNTRNYFNTGLL